MEKVILVTSDGDITIKCIPDGKMLDRLQELVGGFIEIVRPVRMDAPLLFVCNEEGLLKDLPLNPIASILYGMDRHGHPILGDIVILQEGMRDGEPDIVGIPDWAIENIYVQLVNIVNKFYIKEETNE